MEKNQLVCCYAYLKNSHLIEFTRTEELTVQYALHTYSCYDTTFNLKCLFCPISNGWKKGELVWQFIPQPK